MNLRRHTEVEGNVPAPVRRPPRRGGRPDTVTPQGTASALTRRRTLRRVGNPGVSSKVQACNVTVSVHPCYSSEVPPCDATV